MGGFLASLGAAVALATSGQALAQTLNGEVGYASVYPLHVGVSGEVADVSVGVGNRVKAGTLLLTLDDTELKTALAAAEADQAWKQALAEEAERSWERDNELYAEGSLSQVELDLRNIARLEAVAALQRSVAALTTARSRLHRSRIQAPAAGVVLELHTHAGDRINLETNPGPLLVLGSADVVVRAVSGSGPLPESGQGVTIAYGTQEVSASVLSVLPVMGGDGMLITAKADGLLPAAGTAVEIRY